MGEQGADHHESKGEADDDGEWDRDPGMGEGEGEARPGDERVHHADGGGDAERGVTGVESSLMAFPGVGKYWSRPVRDRVVRTDRLMAAAHDVSTLISTRRRS